MAFKINDQCWVELHFAAAVANTAGKVVPESDWYEFPAQHGNVINSIHISGGSKSLICKAQVSVTDNLRFFTWLLFSQNAFSDGTYVRITLYQGEPNAGANPPEPVYRYFRIFSWVRGSGGDQGQVYTIDCYWDSVKYWLQAPFEAISGTSSSVLKEIAISCNLDYFVETTNDSQKWFPGNRRYCVFAQNIAAYGYMDETSHMVFGQSTMGTLIYTNINRITTIDAIPTNVALVGSIGRGDKPTNIAADVSITMSSGIQNTMGGYAHRFIQQKPPAPKMYQAFKDYADFSQTQVFDSALILRSTLIPQDINDRSVVDFRPVDAGNVNDNYERGRAQNMMYNRLNSVTGEFLFHVMTEYEVGDHFYYIPTPTSAVLSDMNKLDAEYEGEFTVASKTIIIYGSVYNEKVTACRNGVKVKE